MVELRTHPQPKGRDRTKPPPNGARASALPDYLRGGGWKRVLRWNCEPTRNRKGGTGQASTYGSARQCPTRPTRILDVPTVAYALKHDEADALVIAATEMQSFMTSMPVLCDIPDTVACGKRLSKFS